MAIFQSLCPFGSWREKYSRNLRIVPSLRVHDFFRSCIKRDSSDDGLPAARCLFALFPFYRFCLTVLSNPIVQTRDSPSDQEVTSSTGRTTVLLAQGACVITCLP